MEFVEPIRDPGMVKDIANYLKKDNMRNYMIFVIGINTGLRISDILKLRVSDVRNKQAIFLKETKTKKARNIKINKVLRRELRFYCAGKDSNECIAKSRNGINKAITRDQAYKILKEVAGMFGLEHIGTHTLRKTFGYHFYQQTKDIGSLRIILGHSSEVSVLRYLGLLEENIHDMIDGFEI